MKINTTALVHKINAVYHSHLRNLAQTFLQVAESKELSGDDLGYLVCFINETCPVDVVRVLGNESYYKDLLEGRFNEKMGGKDVAFILKTLVTRINHYVDESEVEMTFPHPLIKEDDKSR